MKKVLLFPGQGSQAVGMGQDLYDEYAHVKERFSQANEILERPLSSIILEGPEDLLKATENTQPALYLLETTIFDILQQKGLEPHYALGHSLGEYSALYAAGVYSFEDGLRLVATRGQLMSQAGKESEGAMAAVIGLSKDQIASVLESVDGVVVPANENSPDQTVISGATAAVTTACERLQEAGAKRAIMLPVSGAFHSPLMQPAADKFKEVLSTVSFSDARCPVVTNVTAHGETSGETLRDLLVEQLLSPVRWVDSLQFLKDNDALDAVEVGPGNVLKGLARKFDRSLKVASCGTVSSLNSLLG